MTLESLREPAEGLSVAIKPLHGHVVETVELPGGFIQASTRSGRSRYRATGPTKEEALRNLAHVVTSRSAQQD